MDSIENTITDMPFSIPQNKLCDNCHEHKATIVWAGDGGMMGVVHGQYAHWCECCGLKANIKHVEEQTRRLKELRTKLKNVICAQ